MGHGLNEAQVGAINRASVIADKHAEALKRLTEDGVELPEELAQAAHDSAESARRFYDAAEKWKRQAATDTGRN